MLNIVETNKKLTEDKLADKVHVSLLPVITPVNQMVVRSSLSTSHSTRR